MALSYCPAAAASSASAFVCSSLYVRLADFNMSELLDPLIEAETSAEHLKMDLIMIQLSVWALGSFDKVFSVTPNILILLIQHYGTFDQGEGLHGKY